MRAAQKMMELCYKPQICRKNPNTWELGLLTAVAAFEAADQAGHRPRACGCVSCDNLSLSPLFLSGPCCACCCVSRAPFCLLPQLIWLFIGVTPVVIAEALGYQRTSVLPSSSLGPLTESPALQSSVSPSPHDLAVSGPGVLPHRLLYVLLLGLVASRFGLWLFDLAVTQLQQESVPEAELGELCTTLWSPAVPAVRHAAQA